MGVVPVNCIVIFLAVGAGPAWATNAGSNRLAVSAFEEPLVRSAPTTAAEDEPLFQAIRTFRDCPWRVCPKNC